MLFNHFLRKILLTWHMGQPWSQIAAVCNFKSVFWLSGDYTQQRQKWNFLEWKIVRQEESLLHWWSRQYIWYNKHESYHSVGGLRSSKLQLASVRSSKRKQDLIIIIRQLHMSPGYVTSGGRWDWKGCWNRNDRASPWAYYNHLILKYRSPPLIQFPLAWFLMQFCITFCLL